MLRNYVALLVGLALVYAAYGVNLIDSSTQIAVQFFLLLVGTSTIACAFGAITKVSNKNNKST